MGYKSRQKKRAVAVSRSVHRETMNTRWYLTLVTRTCACARCGGVLREKREMVYRHTPRETLCPMCAEADPAIQARPSYAWEKARKRQRGGQRAA